MSSTPARARIPASIPCTMNTRRSRFVLSLVAAGALSAAGVRLAAQHESGPRIEVSFAPGAHGQPVTGMVYVAVSRDAQRTPIDETDTNGVPLFSKYVEGLQPGAPVTFDGSDR